MRTLDQDINTTGTAPAYICLGYVRQDGVVPDLSGVAASLDFRAQPGDEAALLACSETSGHIEFNRTTGYVFLLLSTDEQADLAAVQPFFDVRLEMPGANLFIPRRGRLRVRTPITRNGAVDPGEPVASGSGAPPEGAPALDWSRVTFYVPAEGGKVERGVMPSGPGPRGLGLLASFEGSDLVVSTEAGVELARLDVAATAVPAVAAARDAAVAAVEAQEAQSETVVVDQEIASVAAVEEEGDAQVQRVIDEATALLGQTGGAAITTQWLREITQSFLPTATTRDGQGRIESQTGTYRDGSAGTYTVTRTDGRIATEAYVHALSGKTITFTTTRDGQGRIASVAATLS